MLAEAILTASARIDALGLAPGAVVGVCVTSPIRHLALLGAIARTGHIAMSLYEAGDAERRGVIADCLLTERLEFVMGPKLVVTDDSWFAPSGLLATARARPCQPDAILRIEFSSGTTGTPKAYTVTANSVAEITQTQVPFFARFMWSRASSLMDVQGMWGFHVATSTLISGKTVLLHMSHAEALKVGAVYGADLLIASTGQLAELVRQQKADPLTNLGLRGIVTGGSLMGQRLAEEICAYLSPNVLSVYGSTEASATALAEAPELLAHPKSAGIVLPWVQVRIEDEAGAEVPRGVPGAVKVRPSHGIAQPYVRQPGADARVNEWFAPGDLGILHEDDTLEIIGRLDDLINVGGVKIAPEAIEERLRQNRDVLDCAAFVTTGADGGTALAVAVIVRGGIDGASILRWCADQGLPVGAAHVVDALPRTTSGKVMRHALATRFSGRA